MRYRVPTILAIICGLISTMEGFAATTVYQPGPEDGVDMWYSSVFTYNNSHFVNDTKLQVGGWNDNYWTLIRFDLGCLPKVATSAVLYMMPYSRGDASTPVSMNAYLVTSNWSETTGWSGGLTGYSAGTLPAPVPDTWYGINFTGIYNAWQNGTYANNGLAFTPTAVNNRFNVFRSSDYTVDAGLRPFLIIDYTPDPNEPFRPCFPLSSHTPYKAVVTSVLDHSISSDGYYRTKNQVIQTYNGKIGMSSSNNCYDGSLAGYRQDNGLLFTMPLITYDNEVTGQKNDCIFYDEHSGYDYKAAWHEPILAATDGTLCIATTATSPSGSTPWRKDSKCPYGNDPVTGVGTAATSWDRWHIFYIMHPNGTHSTWYLHADMLASDVWSSVLAQGYAEVTRLQGVAYVGNWGLGCTGTNCKHLHFEVRTGIGTVVDPYGTGSGGILWGPQP